MARAKRRKATGAPKEPAAVWVRTADLVPWDNNPKVHEPGQVDRICDSIRTTAEDAARERGDDEVNLLDGWGAALTARAKSQTIVAGHGRVLAAERLGIEWLPVRFLDISAKQAQRLARADNRLGEPDLAPWDLAILVPGLEADAAEDPDLVTMQGWQPHELQDLINQVTVPDFQPSGDDPPRLDQGGDGSGGSGETGARLVKCPKCGHEFR